MAQIRKAADSPGSKDLGTARLMLAIGLTVAAVGAGTMLLQGGSGGDAAAAAASSATADEQSATDVAPTAIPARSEVPKRTTKSRLRALRHPLIGLSREKLIARLGRPTRRTTEGGSAMEFLEYEIANREFQLVVLKGRVVEVNRFR